MTAGPDPLSGGIPGEVKKHALQIEEGSVGCACRYSHFDCIWLR